MPSKQTSLPISNVADAVAMCKTGCGRKSSISEKWCSVCYARFKRGYYTVNGEISLDVARKQKQLEEKREKRELRRGLKRAAEIKERLQSTLTSAHLKVLSVQNPETGKPQYCDRLSFWTSDVVCYSRLLVSKNKRCAKCSLHDASLEMLLKFMESDYGKTTAIAATQDSDKTVAA